MAGVRDLPDARHESAPDRLSVSKVFQPLHEKLELIHGRPLNVMEPRPVLSRDRRNQASRDALERRIRAEFQEMPGMGLTAAQGARLFGMPREQFERIAAHLVAQGILRKIDADRYRIGSIPA